MNGAGGAGMGGDGTGGGVTGDGGTRAGVTLTHLDQEVFSGAGVRKRGLVDYLDAVADRLVPLLAGRPLSVVRARGEQRFMQKNLPRGAPSWIPTVTLRAGGSGREVHYPLCEDRATLLWLANQRAVEFHVPLTTAAAPDEPTALVVDLDPPEGADLAATVAAARLVRAVLGDAGLDAAVKTSGAKGLHVVVPITGATAEDGAAATRAVTARAQRRDPDRTTTAFLRADRGGRVFLDPTRAGGATVVATYSPRVRPGLPVSWPVGWDELDDVVPSRFTVDTVPVPGDGTDPWAAGLPAPARLPVELVAEGHTIPAARVAALHEGKRRARARRADGGVAGQDRPAGDR